MAASLRSSSCTLEVWNVENLGVVQYFLQYFHFPSVGISSLPLHPLQGFPSILPCCVRQSRFLPFFIFTFNLNISISCKYYIFHINIPYRLTIIFYWLELQDQTLYSWIYCIEAITEPNTRERIIYLTVVCLV